MPLSRRPAMLRQLRRFGKDEEGVSLLEYAVLIAMFLVILLARWMMHLPSHT
jgi:Flp pilus assembly pilin Flp